MIDTEILQDIYTDHDLCGTQRRELVKVIAMIKQNRLIELPCAVGKTACFAEDNGRIVPRKIIRPELLSQGEDFYRNGKLYKGSYYSCSIDYANDHIGQTEEEARERMAWLKLEGVKE